MVDLQQEHSLNPPRAPVRWIRRGSLCFLDDFCCCHQSVCLTGFTVNGSSSGSSLTEGHLSCDHCWVWSCDLIELQHQLGWRPSPRERAAGRGNTISPSSFSWMTEEHVLALSSPSSCRSALEAARPWNAPQFSERQPERRQRYRLLQEASQGQSLFVEHLSVHQWPIRRNSPQRWVDRSGVWIPSADPHSAAQTPTAQSSVWSGADGPAVKQNKISCYHLKCCLIRVCWLKGTGSRKYPGRAADYIGELLDELAGARDDFVGLLLHRVSVERD